MSPGRPRLEFDLGEVEKLGMLGATEAEVAAWFGCGLRTVQRRMGEEEGDFRQAYERGLGRLKISLRRRQIESAKAGNTAMLIWLGKQLLEQRDKREVKEDSTVTQRAEGLSLTPEDEEFLRRRDALRGQSSSDV